MKWGSRTGNLFTQVRETMKLLLTKYLKAFISYRGLYRVESYPVPESALREALINAVVHRNYGSGAPIQIRVYPDKIVFRNTCRLQAGWTVKDLTSKKQSEPYNPDIARVFFWANMIETWGRGIIQMQKACVAYGAPEPKIGGSESDIYVEFKNHDADMAEKLTKKDISEETPLKTPLKTPERILSLLAMNRNMTVSELMQQMDKSESAIKRAIKKLQREGYLKRIGPDKGGYWAVVKKNK
ncbi:MAG: winged helix-turn-helix transcriptional regulator [Bdellovibrionales bacterium]|nr:winged helix-turn-helix transcriptional regulator [Bdellovibrionales bacterium]